LKSNSRSFGALAKAARLSAKRGLREVSREIGISAAYLSRVENDLDVPSGELIVHMARLYNVPLEKLTANAVSPRASAAAHGQTLQESPELRALYRLGSELDSEAIEEFIRTVLREQNLTDAEIEKRLALLKSELPRVAGGTRDGLFAAEAKPRFLTKSRIAAIACEMLQKNGLSDQTYRPPTRVELLVENEPGIDYRIEKLRCDRHENPLVLGLTGWDEHGDRQIVVNSVLADSDRRSDEARFNFTLAHEFFHAVEHLPLAAKAGGPPLARSQVFVEGASTKSDSVAERVVSSWARRSGGSRQLTTDEDWREWQANTFASELLMPDWAVRAEFRERVGLDKLLLTNGTNLRESALAVAGARQFDLRFFEETLATLFAVSRQAMAIRLLQLRLVEEVDVS